MTTTMLSVYLSIYLWLSDLCNNMQHNYHDYHFTLFIHSFRAEHLYHLSAVDGNTLAGSTRVRGPLTVATLSAYCA